VRRAYDLAHTLIPGTPHHPNHPPFGFVLTKTHGEVIYGDEVSASSELLVMGGHVGTHVDALCHISRRGILNGNQSVVGHQSHAGGIDVHPVHELQPLIGEGHVVDLPRLIGRDATPADEIGAAEFDRWFQDHEPPKSGSIVLVRTGWSRYWDDNRRYLSLDAGCPGIVLSGARWLTDRGILATGADTVAYEKTPDPNLPVHVHLLLESGVPIMEAMDLDALVADEVWEFVFVAIPLAIHNGTGSPIRPIALA
jgi:kynurenine formamidase